MNNSCLDQAESISLKVLFAFLAAFDIGLAVWFLGIQIWQKRRGALTRFTGFAALLPIGLGICNAGLYTTGPQKVCKITADGVSLAMVGVGLCIANFAYLSFIFSRSQALLTPRKRIILLTLVILANALLIIQTIANLIIYSNGYDLSETQTLMLASIGALDGVLVLATDISFLAIFISHLRYMNVKLNSWLTLTKDDDAMRVIAKTGFRCSILVLSASLLNIFSYVIDSYDLAFVYEIEFFITMVLLTSLSGSLFNMKFKVDRAQSRNGTFKDSESASFATSKTQKNSAASDETGVTLESV